MEYLTKIMETGAAIAGDQKQLESVLELARGTITEVKKGRRGLPLEACYKLADMTGADLVRLIAENEAITAKAEKAEFWKKKLRELEAVAAVLILSSVTTVVTPSPAKAAPLSQVVDFSVYIMSNIRRAARAVRGWFAGFENDTPTTSQRLACCPS